MPRRSPVRLVLALSVAAALAIFLLYTSIAGGGTPQLKPSQVKATSGEIALVGIAIRPGNYDDAYRPHGLRFKLRDRKGDAMVPVVYHGQVPPLFKGGREVVVSGEMKNGVFVAKQDSLVTKCPSKYSPKKA